MCYEWFNQAKEFSRYEGQLFLNKSSFCFCELYKLQSDSKYVPSWND